LALSIRQADDVRGQAVAGGHFILEWQPDFTAALLENLKTTTSFDGPRYRA
jgi:hypothetical protein